ncbi:MAG: EAL domain-containing protein [Clostridia bacterium]|nr:EAL domain-containing protein [Clostridia bacterium]
MKIDWLNLGGREADYQTVLDRLNGSPYDELVEIDLINDRCRNLWHVENKYYVPVLHGNWSELYRYCADHMIHPQDRERYCGMMDPDTVILRLERSEVSGVLSEELRYRTVDGKWRWVRQVLVSGAQNGLPEGVIYSYMYDIDVQKQRELGGTAASGPTVRRDDLTGLLLDREFYALAQQRLPALAGKWCVVALDIENFKLFCDWHGQQSGNFLLAQIGEILGRLERETGGLAGYRGQDDFELLIPYDTARIGLLFDELQRVIETQGDSVGFLPMFGICMVESPEDEITELYNHAALTAEQIKGDFKNRIQIYDPDVHKRNTEEYQILSAFQRGLDNHEIFFCLQPQCRVSSGRIVGAESLARWRTAEGRIIPPARFVPILEKHGIVTNLDKYIWEGVCAWLRKWIDAGNTPVPISVNVSQIDIFSIDVPEFFNGLLEKYRLPARLIKIEITESAYVEDTAAVRETVRRLRSLGFLVLMDDFGSGYSSLNMLRSLNVDIIKLDAQFLHISQNESRKGISILESIVNMAKTMAIPVIVEGVETIEQINFLADLGCRYMQGYYFYRPMPVEEFENLIADPRNVDLNGFEFKANDQFHTREFLDENLVSDVMLNNILGPVAIYRWNGNSVDIIRYNQQFYQMVGIEINQLEARRMAIEQFMYPEDREKFFRLLERAAADRLNGARAVVRVYKPNGALSWISLQMYFMEENEQGVHFYGASEDVTELQYINQAIPGGYHRCAVDGGFEFYFISEGFHELVGFTAEEIKEKFDNRFINMVHRDDVDILMQRSDDILHGRVPSNKPYRIKRKDGGYISVMNQSCVTELNGQVCFQSVAIDVTEVVKLRNQMRLISQSLTNDVVFVRRKGEGWKYRVVVHGLEKRIGMTSKAFEKILNSGELFRSLSADEAARLEAVTVAALKEMKPVEYDFTLATPNGPVRLHMKNDYVKDRNSKVEYICVFREISD